ncbi:MAG: VIT family protein [Micrococcaceae bacterium]
MQSQENELPPSRDHDHRVEPLGSKLNWLRAGVLGANDGIVSIAGMVIGVAGATSSKTQIITAGLAGLVAGAFSMAGGEYVSVSSQKDAESAALKEHLWELDNYPEEEEEELAEMWAEKGLSKELADQVAKELTEKDALKAHAEIELGIDPDELTSPWHAAFASFTAFTIGGLLPLLAILIPPVHQTAIISCVIMVVISLIATGWLGAYLGKARILPAIIRNLGIGIITMAVTYFVGAIFGAHV